MRATKDNLGQDRVLIKVFVNQKSEHRIKKTDGTYVNLVIRTLKGSINGWYAKPTIGEAITECGEIKIGDDVMCPYTAFDNERLEIKSTDLKKIGYELGDDEKVYSVAKSMCWFVFRNEEPICFGDNMICKRVYRPYPKDNIITVMNKEKYDNYVYVEKMPENPSLYEKDGMSMSSISPGDIIAVEKFSDVEFTYTCNNEDRSLIRVNFGRDFLGVINNSLEYEF